MLQGVITARPKMARNHGLIPRDGALHHRRHLQPLEREQAEEEQKNAPDLAEPIQHTAPSYRHNSKQSPGQQKL
jgi:hypothetical protein